MRKILDHGKLIFIDFGKFLGVTFHIFYRSHSGEIKPLPSFKRLFEKQLWDHSILGVLQEFHFGGLSIAVAFEVAKFPADDARVLDMFEVVLDEDFVLVVVELLIVLHEAFLF